MIRRCVLCLAGAFPRQSWDPLQHNSRWVDSYAKAVSDRRSWPAKKYSVGLEPRTPREWLEFSYRNLAYAYNGAMRACATFPEMIPYYQEMKHRGVKVDVDTMFVLLSRGARYHRMTIEDLFELHDELLSLGARPDIAIVEIMHTAFEQRAGTLDPAWSDWRREQLVEEYESLAKEDIARLGPRRFEALLREQFARYRKGITSLGFRVCPDVWEQYVAQIRSSNALLEEVANFLWDYAPDEEQTPFVLLRAINVRVPILGPILRSAAKNAEKQDATPVQTSGTTGPYGAECDINRVLLAAVERVVDYPLQSSTKMDARGLVFALVTIMWKAEVLMGPDFIAQAMDAVKHDREDPARQDSDAMKYLRFAYAGAPRVDRGIRASWWGLGTVVDARVIGRYIAARDPWSSSRFAIGRSGTYETFPSARAAASNVASNSSDLTSSALTLYRPDDVDMRVSDVRKLLKNSEVFLRPQKEPQDGVEVYTGMMAFLRRMVLSQPRNIDVAAAVFRHMQDVKSELDAYCEKMHVEPELECWESFLLITKTTLDAIVLSSNPADKPRQAASPATGANSQGAQEDAGSAQHLQGSFFDAVSKFREDFLRETKERFSGRFSVLWLQEA